MTAPLRILLVEDLSADAELLSVELARAPMPSEVVQVAHREGFIRALDAAWDAVVADYMLPGFTALEALSLLRERDPFTPFIVVSGRIGEETAIAAMRAGAHDYVFKDNLRRLVPALTREVQAAAQRRAAQQLEEDLMQAEVLAGVGALAGGAVHAINNPLAVITSNLEFLQDTLPNLSEARARGADAGVDREVREALNDAVRAGEAAVTVMRDLMTFARNTRTQAGPVQLAAVLHAAGRLSEHAIRRRGRLQLEIEPDLEIWGDVSSLGHLFLNLLMVATHALPSERQDSIVELRAERVAERVRVALRFPTAEASTVAADPALRTARRIVGSGHGVLQLDPAEVAMAMTVELPVGQAGWSLR